MRVCVWCGVGGHLIMSISCRLISPISQANALDRNQYSEVEQTGNANLLKPDLEAEQGFIVSKNSLASEVNWTEYRMVLI